METAHTVLDYVNDRDVESLWNTVHREIRRRGVDPQTADDLAQEAWLRTLRRSPEKGDLKGWLRVVGRRLVSEMRRQGRNRRAREQEVARAEGLIDVPPPSESRLTRLVDQLGEPYRSVIQARFFEGLEVTEIARRTGHSSATVRSQLHRGLNQLRVRLGIAEPRRRSLRGFFLWFLPSLRRRWDRPRVFTLAASAVVAVLGGWGAWTWLQGGPRGALAGVPDEVLAQGSVLHDSLDGEPRAPIATAPAPVEVATGLEPGRPVRGVSGRVLLPDGRAAAGATVWAGELENGAERRIGLTDAFGHYEVPAIGLHEYLWASTGDGLLSRRCFIGSMPEADDHDLRLLPSPGRLLLTLEDGSGSPVQGARAWLDGEVGGALVSVVTRSGAVEIPTRSMRRGETDAEGRVALPKPDRPRLALFVELGGVLIATPELVGVPGDQELDLTLPMPGRIEGVVRGPGGAVRAGLPVELRVVNDVVRRTRSDDQGRFAFEELPPQLYLVWTITEAPEKARSAGQSVAVAAGEHARVELQLDTDQVVSGTVLEDGRPLQGARVKLFLQRRDGIPAIFEQVVDDQGGFRYPGQGPDVLRADVFVPGRELPVACSDDIVPGSGPVVLEVPSGARRLVPVTIAFQGGDAARAPVLAAVRGRFPRVLVQATVDPATHQATFELPPGRYGVYAWVPGLGPWLARERLEVAEDDRADLVRRFTIPRPGRLRVHLDRPLGITPAQVDIRIQAGVFSPFGFSELGSVECRHEFESDAEGRILEVDLLPGRVGCEITVPGHLDEQRVLWLSEGELIDLDVHPEAGREVELVVDSPVHFGIHESIELTTRTADGSERVRVVQPIGVRNELDGGRRIEVRLFLVLPLDTVTLTLATSGATGELRWAPGELAEVVGGTRYLLRLALTR